MYLAKLPGHLIIGPQLHSYFFQFLGDLLESLEVTQKEFFVSNGYLEKHVFVNFQLNNDHSNGMDENGCIILGTKKMTTTSVYI